MSATQSHRPAAPKLNEVAGARLFLQPATDIRVGGRASNAQYQYTLQGDDTDDIYEWAPKIEAALQKLPLVDRRQSRPAAKGARDRSGHRPGDRGAARAHRQPDRQHALRRVRPASGVGDLRRAKPIPCRHGGGAGILAEPGHPEPDLCQHQRRRGQRHAGDQCAGRNGARPKCRPQNSANAATTTAQIAGDTARNQANNALANTGRSATSTGAAVSTSRENDGAAFRISPISARATRRSPSITRIFSSPRRSRSTWRRTSRSARRRRRSRTRWPAGRAGVDPRQLSGHRQGLSAIARQPAVPDRGGAACRLYRARRALRELYPPDHDPVDLCPRPGSARCWR